MRKDEGRRRRDTMKLLPSFYQILSTNIDDLATNTLGSIQGQILLNRKVRREVRQDR
jgi:glycopeptide antibiotics resistance protein